jgi:hypothetical protein
VLPASASRTAAALLAVAVLGLARAATAFPPYRSTDAEVATEGVLEVRAGLGRWQRERDENRYRSPLLRVNLGIGHGLELVSELEFDPEEGRLGDGACGLKWASAGKSVSLGVETLALLPVSSEHSGAGVESQLLATLRRAPFQLHVNAGGFHDSRPGGGESESGWRASLLGEWERGPARVGAELFARQVHAERVFVQAGPGLIWSFGRVDVRAGLHAGLTAEAPDLMASLWLSTKWKLW